MLVKGELELRGCQSIVESLLISGSRRRLIFFVTLETDGLLGEEARLRHLVSLVNQSHRHHVRLVLIVLLSLLPSVAQHHRGELLLILVIELHERAPEHAPVAVYHVDGRPVIY